MPSRPKPHKPVGEFRQHTLYEDKREGAFLLAKKIRSSGRWRKCAAKKLRIDPLCEDPLFLHRDEGRSQVADQVHHIKGVAMHPNLAYTMDNLMSICDLCHHNVEARERKGVGGIPEKFWESKKRPPPPPN